jgi:hypothetical protein
MTDDELAYLTYAEFAHWYDKLWLSKTLGYFVGDTSIPKNGVYIIRPRLNLQGCGIDAEIGFYNKNSSIPPNCFWCEVFHGEHTTIAYTFGDGNIPADGGTKNTWNKAKTTKRIHIDLKTLRSYNE